MQPFCLNKKGEIFRKDFTFNQKIFWIILEPFQPQELLQEQE